MVLVKSAPVEADPPLRSGDRGRVSSLHCANGLCHIASTILPQMVALCGQGDGVSTVLQFWRRSSLSQLPVVLASLSTHDLLDHGKWADAVLEFLVADAFLTQDQLDAELRR